MEIGTVRQVDIDQTMQGAYLDYAMSVIVARALPDVRDGLKPVQRRVLYAMHDMGLHHTGPYKKSARIVGEVLGKYHPHGDAAVYDAMVRLAQDFSMRYPLIDGQGNFGSVDGDSAAAMRYTEARLSVIAQEMLNDIQKDTVEFGDNFDGSLTEPSVLPAALPNLLVNGSSGIAVGMATSIPPHNLGEICDALGYMIDHYKNVDKVGVDDLMRFVKGPDFPTAGLIYRFAGGEGSEDNIKQAYATGKGRIVVQAKTRFEELSRGRSSIIISELPYQVNKTGLIERIADLARDEKIDGITDLRDESDRQGMRIVIELSRTAEPNGVLNALFKYTPLQMTFGITMLALVDGEPRMLPLKRALQLFVEHRREIITRRTKHDLAKAEERAHILEGLRIALGHLDEVIKTIRQSPDTDTARQRLMKRFKLSERQATAILDMQLRRLAALERQKIDDEYKQTKKLIVYLQELLKSPQKILQLIKDELSRLKSEYADQRRSTIVEGEIGAVKAEDLMADVPVIVMGLQNNRVTRLLNPGRRSRAEKDLAWYCLANNRDEILMLSNRGRAFRVRAGQIPDQNQNGDGVPLGSLLSIDSEERVVCGLALPATADAAAAHGNGDAAPRAKGTPASSRNPVESQAENSGLYLVTASRMGQVKRSAAGELQGTRASGTLAMKLDEGDELIGAALSHGADEYIIVTSDGNAIRFSEESVRPMGMVAGGVAAIKLSEGASVVGFGLASAGGELVVVTQSGHGKRTKLEEYPAQGRYGVGVRTSDVSGRSGPIAGAWVADDEDQATLLSAKNAALVTQAKLIGRAGRVKRGGTVMELKQGDSVARLIPLMKRVALPAPAPARSVEAQAETLPAKQSITKQSGKADHKATATTESRRNGSNLQPGKSRTRRR